MEFIRILLGKGKIPLFLGFFPFFYGDLRNITILEKMLDKVLSLSYNILW